MLDPLGLTKKATFTFTAKIFWFVVRHNLSLANDVNVLTWDKVVFVSSLVTELDIYFSKVLIMVIHERDFKTYTTYPFSCLILQLYKDAEVPILH